MLEPRLTICGLMSGSSLDGLDLAICSFNHDADNRLHWSIDKAATIPFHSDLANDLLACYHSTSSFIYRVEQQFSDFCAKALSEFIGGIHVDYLGFHGHTIFHEPALGFTTQIGNAHHIAQKIEIPVIAQFRNKDVALGGQGAPLAPIVEKYLLSDYKAFLNLGGIVNISIHDENKIIAYDITACNQALNHLAAEFDLPYDDRGKIAAKGRLNKDLLSDLDQLEFLSDQPPKSLSNTWVQQEFISLIDESTVPTEDKMHTIVHHIASEIAKSSRDLKTGSEIYCAGGGVYNDFMMNQINKELNPKGVKAVKADDEIAEFKEALLMALMAYLRVNEVPNCLACVTGASRDSCGGIIYNHHL